MRALAIAALALGCGPETTSFRTIDRGDQSDRDGPPAAAYDVQIGGHMVANVHVWSDGGYIGTSDEPMTHVGFEIQNLTARPYVFESDSLQLLLFDSHGRALPAPVLTAVTPLGAERYPIPPGTTKLDAYFMLRVRPRVVDRMSVRWSLSVGTNGYLQTTSFTRSDDYPVYEPPTRPETRVPSS